MDSQPPPYEAEPGHHGARGGVAGAAGAGPSTAAVAGSGSMTHGHSTSRYRPVRARRPRLSLTNFYYNRPPATVATAAVTTAEASNESAILDDTEEDARHSTDFALTILEQEDLTASLAAPSSSSRSLVSPSSSSSPDPARTSDVKRLDISRISSSPLGGSTTDDGAWEVSETDEGSIEVDDSADAAGKTIAAAAAAAALNATSPDMRLAFRWPSRPEESGGRGVYLRGRRYSGGQGDSTASGSTRSSFGDSSLENTLVEVDDDALAPTTTSAVRPIRTRTRSMNFHLESGSPPTVHHHYHTHHHHILHPGRDGISTISRRETSTASSASSMNEKSSTVQMPVLSPPPPTSPLALSSTSATSARQHHHSRRHSSMSTGSSILFGTGRHGTGASGVHRKRTNSGGGSMRRSHSQRRKSQLLCLWPMPMATRMVILLSVFISTLTTSGVLAIKCSAPTFVIHRSEYFSLLLSPFLFNFSLPGLLLACNNLLCLGLFEESLTSSPGLLRGGTKAFAGLFAALIGGVCVARQLLGYLFSHSTGYAVPELFFSNSLHECNQGLAPFLFSLLVIQSLSIDDKYYIYYGDRREDRIAVRKFTLQLCMAMLNYANKNILWWSLTGLLCGFLATLGLHLGRVGDVWERDPWSIKRFGSGSGVQGFSRMERGSIYGEKGQPVGREHQPSHHVSHIRAKRSIDMGARTARNTLLILYARLVHDVQKASVVLAITLTLLLTANAIYQRPMFIDPVTFNTLDPTTPWLFTFVLMSAPRPGNPNFLLRTIDSYLGNFPANRTIPSYDVHNNLIQPTSFYGRTQMVAYTHFTNHSIFEQARESYSHDPKARQYLKWYQEAGEELNQRDHVSRALDLVTREFNSTYVVLVEDDFPMCEGKWAEMIRVTWNAQHKSPNHCGVFVGTGGSGLIIRQDWARLMSTLLIDDKETAPDLILQNCLLGSYAGCEPCAGSMVSSKTLLQYHLGFNASTVPDRKYKRGEWQCGWRAPLNGHPDVMVL